MKQARAPAPPPMQISVKIYDPSKNGTELANATVTLNDCFAVRGIQIKEGKNGPFVSMPSRLVKGEYKDYCFPCTKEFKREFDEAVLDAYHQQLSQKDGMQKDEAPAPEEAKARQGLAMTM